MKMDDGTTTILSMDTTDALAKVTAFYQAQADKAGIAIGMNLSTPDSAMLGGNKDGLEFSYTAGPKVGGGTTANLTFKTKD